MSLSTLHAVSIAPEAPPESVKSDHRDERVISALMVAERVAQSLRFREGSDQVNFRAQSQSSDVPEHLVSIKPDRVVIGGQQSDEARSLILLCKYHHDHAGARDLQTARGVLSLYVRLHSQLTDTDAHIGTYPDDTASIQRIKGEHGKAVAFRSHCSATHTVSGLLGPEPATLDEAKAALDTLNAYAEAQYANASPAEPQ
jgi:hypothetical protein